MKRIINFYYLAQAIMFGMFITQIYHTFASGFDDIMLIVSGFVVIISLWGLFGGKSSFLVFLLYLLYSVFVGLFLFALLILGGGGWLSLILCMLHSALNLYLAFYVLKKDSNNHNHA